MTNIEYFKFSGQNPEPIIDPYYNRDKVVVPSTAEKTNRLVEKNSRLIELISVFSYFSPTFHVREQNPSGCWGFAHRSSLHSRFGRVGSFA